MDWTVLLVIALCFAFSGFGVGFLHKPSSFMSEAIIMGFSGWLPMGILIQTGRTEWLMVGLRFLMIVTLGAMLCFMVGKWIGRRVGKAFERLESRVEWL